MDTKNRMFQYKILNNILYPNRRLYLMKKVESPLFSMCDMEIETLAHWTIHCKYSKNYGRIKNKDAVASYHFLIRLKKLCIWDGFLKDKNLN